MTSKVTPSSSSSSSMLLSLGEMFNSLFGNRDEGQAPEGSLRIHVFQNGYHDNGRSMYVTPRDCQRTEHSKPYIGEIVCAKMEFEKTCTLYSSFGTRIESCGDIKNDDNIYMVPTGRWFMWPTHEIGHSVQLDHVHTSTGLPIVMETLSQSPRVYSLKNFISEAEAEQLIENALTITEENYRLKRSSTGAQGYHVDNYRTSEGAFDTWSEAAVALKKRSFELLGMPYDETFSDGLQVLRYNLTTAYIPHLDWIEPTPGTGHDWDSAGEGTNRYATILFYLSDVSDGGETVFTQAKHNNDKQFATKADATKETIDYLDSKNLTHHFPENSWQRNMIVECRSRLSIKAYKANAIMFYSQHANGAPDRLSLHGGCPVLEGTKWAANLWVWNGPRSGYSSGRAKANANPDNVLLTFTTKDVKGAKLYWEDQYWDDMVPGKVISVNSFGGHKWNIRLDDK